MALPDFREKGKALEQEKVGTYYFQFVSTLQFPNHALLEPPLRSLGFCSHLRHFFFFFTIISLGYKGYIIEVQGRILSA